ncbi:MAG: AAA family ATPase [Deltaproteobacteria bacterium]|nr:AAA family ATPase [Deltaproteobacteria bacterium]
MSIDTNTFRKIIEGGYVYVDKTGYLHELITSPITNYFISRPRRFGKSLLLDTVAEIFKGDRELFKGLKIADTDYDFDPHPVLTFNMDVASRSPEHLESRLMDILIGLADIEKVELKLNHYDTALGELIRKVRDKYNKNVVVIIDEYDDAVSSKIDNAELAKQNADILRTFYSSFKSSNKFLRFALITGVNRYAMSGVSSGFNILTDISLDEKYAAICGFTHVEMDYYYGGFYSEVLKNIINSKQYTESRIIEQKLAKGLYPNPSAKPTVSVIENESDLRAEILKWYDGYTWDGKTRVLNPISINNFFYKSKFDAYWRYTATTKNFLEKIFSSNPFEFTKDKLENVPKDDIVSVNLETVKSAPLLFQTGYITVKTIVEGDDSIPYSFKIPNYEVSEDYLKVLSAAAEKYLVDNLEQERTILESSIFNRDAAALSKIFEEIFSKLKTDNHTRHTMKYGESISEWRTEFFYNSIIFIYLYNLLGKSVVQDEPWQYGNPDFTLHYPKRNHAIMEVKYAFDSGQKNIDVILDTLAKNALETIKKKKYGAKYGNDGDRVVTIGMGVFGRGEVKILFGDD